MARVNSGFAALVLAGLVAATGPVAAQEDAGGLPLRYPSEGIAVIDCAPSAPAPDASCVLRVPPGYGRNIPHAVAMAGGEAPAFRLLGAGRDGFPEGLDLSVTLLLIDLSPGPQNGRAETFAHEKALIGDFIAMLPATEPVAIYGFNQQLELLEDFTTDKAALLDTVQGLELKGTNTRIATFVADAVSVLAEQDDAILRNLVLVSDGQEEGSEPVGEAVSAALKANVSISAIGSFWRRVGSAETAAGMDFLDKLTGATSGLAAQAILRRAEASSEAVTDFAADYTDALLTSGLILPQDAPRNSRISLVLREPIIGRDGEFRDVEIEVSYLPEGETPAEVPEEEPVVKDTIFGLPTLYVYLGAGLLALLALFGVAFALMKRGGAPEEAEEIEEVVEDSAPVVAPPPPAQAYLVLSDSNRRIAIAAPRINVGRGGANEIVIEDESISRLHAQIHRNRDGGFSITDMDSLNGTFVNGDRVRGTMALNPGDTVAFGRVATRLIAA